MALRKQHIALGVAIVVFSTMSFAQNDLRNQILKIENVRQALESGIESTRDDLTEKTQEIEKIKNGNGFVSKLLLQKKLREAQAVSKNLEAQVKKHSQLSQSLREQRSNLLDEIDSQIKSLSSGKDLHRLPQLQQLQKLIAEKDQLLNTQQQSVLEIPDFNLSSTHNEKEDLVEKLHVVEDLQKNMNQKIAFLKDELSEERSKEFLQNEVSHFLDEENFFGEQSFISSGLNRKDNSKNLAALALKKDITTTPPVTTDPAPPPAEPNTVPTAETTTPAETSPVQTTSQSTSFQQPQELNMFETLLDQIQESIRDTNPKSTVKTTATDIAPVKTQNRKISKKTKRGALEQNLALSEKILSDLDILRQNLSHQIQDLE